MKKLITANDVKKAAEAKKNTLYVEPGTIITPAAKDSANELNIRIVEEDQPQLSQEATQVAAVGKAEITLEFITKIVKEVMASLPGLKQPEMLKESDPSGLRLVKGNTVVCQKSNTGKASDKVYIKEILTKNESPHMTTGFMQLENTSFSREQKYEEINYITEGTLEITLNGRTYHGEAGDVFYLPKDTSITLSSPGKVNLFFVGYP